MAVGHHTVDVQVHVASLGRVREQPESKGVAAALRDTVGVVRLLTFHGLLHLPRGQVPSLEGVVQALQGDTVHHVQGIDHVAQRLRHLAPVGIPHHGVQIHGLEGELVHQPQGHHHHPCHPEEKNVVPSLQQGPREEGLEVIVALLVGPPEHGEREQAGGEPRVQHVLILHDLHVLPKLLCGLLVGLLLGAAHEPHLLVLCRLHHLVGRNPVAPPQLPADAPILDVVQPVEPGLLVLLREDLQLPTAHGGGGPGGQLLAVHPPLGNEIGLDDVPGPRASTEAHGVGLLVHKQPFSAQRLLDCLSRLVPVLAHKLATQLVDVPVVVEDRNELQAVPLTHVVIVGIVGRGNLHRPGPELLVHVRVRHHHHLPVGEKGVHQLLAHQRRVALVLGVHGYSYIPEHGLQTGGGHGDAGIGTLHLVAERGQRPALHRLRPPGNRNQCPPHEVVVIHFQIRQSGTKVRAPVHQSGAAEDLALLVEAHEGFLHGGAQHLVHGEPLSGPVHGYTDTPELKLNALAVLLLPIPHALQESLASVIMPGLLLVRQQLLLHHGLGCDARVVHPRDPAHHSAGHAVPSAQGILDGHGQRVPQMERPRHVGRRNHHHEPLGLLGSHSPLHVRRKEPPLLPPIAPGALHRLWVIPGGHRLGGVLLLALRSFVDERHHLSCRGLRLLLFRRSFRRLLLLGHLHLAPLPLRRRRRGLASRASVTHQPVLHRCVELVILKRSHGAQRPGAGSAHNPG
mmetsp:Transcript_40170/g.96285  ORF Transcript_40170/g.96285 Transcript_40170/m.96285 type:complete len:738 (+) Transcript_40170:1120-3333(+)